MGTLPSSKVARLVTFAREEKNPFTFTMHTHPFISKLLSDLRLPNCPYKHRQQKRAPPELLVSYSRWRCLAAARGTHEYESRMTAKLQNAIRIEMLEWSVVLACAVIESNQPGWVFGSVSVWFFFLFILKTIYVHTVAKRETHYIPISTQMFVIRLAPSAKSRASWGNVG